MTIDFNLYPHPVMAVECPTCHAAPGHKCKRPSGHRASAFHAERMHDADAAWHKAGKPPCKIWPAMTGTELAKILEQLEISQAMLARRITAEGGRPFDAGTINRYIHARGGREIPAIFAAYMRLLAGVELEQPGKEK